MTTASTEETNSPTHYAYQVKEGKEKSYWTRIGAAWAHKDGKGFSLQLDAVPLDGKVQLRTVSESQ